MHKTPLRTLSTRLALAGVLALASGVASAQTTQGVLGRTEGRQASGGYYTNALPNEPTIRVTVRGDVPRTGIYDLGRGFDDVESLLAVAGGPSAEDLDPRDPTVLVRVIRGAGAARRTVYEATYPALAGGEAPPPGLRDGDTFEVETRYERGLYVWGAVGRPGYYEVGPAVDAVRLLALAGGPQGGGARASDVVNDATVAVVRPGVGVVYESDLQTLIAGVSVPPLQDGDALQVEVITRNKFSFFNAIQAIGAVAAFALVIVRVVDAVSN